jgi:p-aminobenzoyl-glutamate transporter AbgT
VTKTLKRPKDIIKVLNKTITSVKYYYLFLAFFYSDLVKHINNVKLSIKLSCVKLKERFLKKKEKITVLNNNYI